MSYVAMLAEIKTQLESVTDIGKVHDYIRFVYLENEIVAQFKDTASGQIRAWQITRTDSSEEYADVNIASRRIHRFEIRGIMSIKDSAESEKVFQALIEDVCDKFRPLYNLNGEAERIVAPIQVEDVENRMWGAVGVHTATLVLEVQETLTF